MKYIPVKAKSGILSAIVDDEDYEYLCQYSWFINGKAGYAVRNIYIFIDDRKVRRSAYMHRDIMHALPGQLVDHKNRQKLDNRRQNLRFATHSQNAFNRVLTPKGKSGIRGVYWNKQKQNWRTNILVEGKEIHLGFFEDVNLAAQARLRAEQKYYG